MRSRSEASVSIEDLEARYRALQAELGTIGIMVPGSVNRCVSRCAAKGCHCRADPPQLHGPYWNWTRKVKSKTRTVRLQPDEVAQVEEWIENRRRFKAILREMESLALEVAEKMRSNRI